MARIAARLAETIAPRPPLIGVLDEAVAVARARAEHGRERRV